MGCECSDVTLTNGPAMLAETCTSPLISISSSHRKPPNPHFVGYTCQKQKQKTKPSHTLATTPFPCCVPIPIEPEAQPSNKMH